jgi:GMP synthase (glutamine-hydrolysing)
VILSGGPASVLEAGSPRAPAGDLRFRRAGARHLLRPEAMAAQLGGKVEGGHHREFGRADVEVTESPLFDGVWERASAIRSG